MDIDSTSFLAIAFFIGISILLIIKLFQEIREHFVTPIKKAGVFKELIEQDGFIKLKKNMEERNYLKETLTGILNSFDYNNPLETHEVLFLQDMFDYYFADILLAWEIQSERTKGVLKWQTKHTCLFIDTSMNLPGNIRIKKRKYDISNNYRFTKGEVEVLEAGFFPKEFSDRFSVSADPEVAKEIIIRDVQELLEKHDLKYPFTQKVDTESEHVIGRDLYITQKGILMIGNPSCNRIDIAEMMELGKKLIAILEVMSGKDL